MKNYYQLNSSDSMFKKKKVDNTIEEGQSTIEDNCTLSKQLY